MKLQILSQEDTHRIHAAALDVLESGGVWFNDCPEAVELLEKNGCTADGYRVRIPRKLTEECLQRLPNREGLEICSVMLGFAEPASIKQGQTHIGLIGNPYYLYDHKNGQRDLTDGDLDDKFLILDCLGNFEFDVCCCITESQRKSGVTFPDYGKLDLCLEYLRRRVNSRPASGDKKLSIHANIIHAAEENPRIHSPAVFRPLEKMELLRHAIICGAEQTKELLGKDTPLVWCNPISPLQYHHVQVREIMQAIDKFGSDCFVMISPEVMNGATGPVTIAGALTQQNAEVLAGVVLTQLYGPGTPVIYGSVGGAFDMRVGQISHGNFETATFNNASVDMADFYGMPSRVVQGNTSARQTGTRAASETAAGLLMALASGGSLITTGLLDSTLMLSHEHLVLVDELVNQFKGAFSINTDKAHLAKELIIEQGHPNPDFLSSDHALKFMQEAVYYSDFTGRTAKSYEDWYDIAHEKVKEILVRKHDDAEEQKIVSERLSAVEARLKEDDTTWHESKDDWWEFYLQDI